MNIFEPNYDYDHDYQSYLDWKEKDEREQLEQEYDMAWEYEQEEVETTGERCVREALEPEEDVRQLAQVSVGGVFRYDIHWLPETHEVRVEVDHFQDGSPMYLWFPDTMGTIQVLARVLGVSEEQARITGLTFFKDDVMLVALDYEQRQFMNNINNWRDYAESRIAMQFNVEIACPNKCYDAACDGTNCEFKPQHGLDGTQCDCSNCTLDYGYCSCGCGGNHQLHEEWLAEREKERQAFVHETVTPPPTPEPEPESPKPTLEIEEDGESTSSVESVEEKEDRLWSDFKLALFTAFMALLMGIYMCRTLGC